MEQIARHIESVRESLPENVTLVAVSKFHPAEVVMKAYEAGHRVFGESRANELKLKASTMPDDIEWHFIGHLQTNKVRQIVGKTAMIESVDSEKRQILPYVSLIQSIDSERLLRIVNDEAVRIGRIVDVLLQVHVAKEETKFGFTPDEIIEFASSWNPASTPGVRIRGVMGMASNVDDDLRIRRDFSDITATFRSLAEGPFAGHKEFDTISMGMSHDYTLAVECGSNMVRIGTTIFGEREY